MNTSEVYETKMLQMETALRHYVGDLDSGGTETRATVISDLRGMLVLFETIRQYQPTEEGKDNG